jgi:uncharacterized protein (TIGR02391 family)
LNKLTSYQKKLLSEIWNKCQPIWVGPPWTEFDAQNVDDPQYNQARAVLRKLSLVDTAHGPDQSRIRFNRAGFHYLPPNVRRAAGQHVDFVARELKTLYKDQSGKPPFMLSELQRRTKLDYYDLERTLQVLSELGQTGFLSIDPADRDRVKAQVSIDVSIGDFKDYKQLLSRCTREYQKSLKAQKQWRPPIVYPNIGGLPGGPDHTVRQAKPSKRDFGVEIVYDKLIIHPEIRRVSKNLFLTKNYASSILEAFKAINNLVKARVKGLTKEDGKALMAQAFLESRPMLKLNDLLSDSEKNEQEGFRFIFQGCQVGIRNPKAHEFVVLKNPIHALQYLGLADLLARRVDEATLVRPATGQAPPVAPPASTT